MMIQNLAEPCKWFGETIGFWIQTTMLAVSAGAGIWIIISRGNQEARRATVDLIVEQKHDGELIAAKKALNEMHQRHETNLARYMQDEKSSEYKAILLALNNHEFIAAGIRTRSLSEQVYKRMRYSQIMRDWEALQGFVVDFRKQKEICTLFQDFEWLYNRWKKKALKNDK